MRAYWWPIVTAALLSGCIYNGTGGTLVSMGMIHRLLPEPAAAATREPDLAAPALTKADPKDNHFIYWLPEGRIHHKRQMQALVFAALAQAKRAADAELCNAIMPIKERIVAEVGPELTETPQGKAWFFRLSWRPSDEAVCGDVTPGQYYQAVSRHLPSDAFIYQAATPDDEAPRIFRQGESIQNVLELLELMYRV